MTARLLNILENIISVFVFVNFYYFFLLNYSNYFTNLASERMQLIVQSIKLFGCNRKMSLILDTFLWPPIFDI